MGTSLAQKLKEDKTFIRSFVMLALPIGFQSLIQNVNHTISSLLVGQLGDMQVSATSLAGQVYFVLNMLIVGVVSGTSVFLAQYFGKGDHRQLRISAALGLVLIAAVSLIFTLASLAAPANILSLFSHEAVLVELAAGYLKIVSLSYVPTALALGISMVFRNIGLAKLPLHITLLGIVVNVGLSFCLIFGYLGFPELGINGAAVSIVISKLLEMALFVYFLYAKHRRYAPRLGDLFRMDRRFLRSFSKVSAPVIFNEAIWGVGVALYSIVYFNMGYTVGAAAGIAKVLQQLLIAFLIGAGYAAAIILGQKLGEGNKAEAVKLSRKMAAYTSLGGIGLGLILAASIPLFLMLYQGISPEVKRAVINILIYDAIIIPLKGANFIHIMGTLRAGGDTFMCMIIDNLSLWCVSLPLTFLFGYFLDFGIGLVYLFVLLDDVAKFFIIRWRIRSGAWIHNLL